MNSPYHEHNFTYNNKSNYFSNQNGEKMNNKDSNERLSFWAMNDDGTNVKFDILFSFETNLKNLIYTDNTSDEDGNINVYASTCNFDGDNYKLCPISSEKEWMIIEAMLNEFQNHIVNKQGDF